LSLQAHRPPPILVINIDNSSILTRVNRRMGHRAGKNGAMSSAWRDWWDKDNFKTSRRPRSVQRVKGAYEGRGGCVIHRIVRRGPRAAMPLTGSGSGRGRNRSGQGHGALGRRLRLAPLLPRPTTTRIRLDWPRTAAPGGPIGENVVPKLSLWLAGNSPARMMRPAILPVARVSRVRPIGQGCRRVSALALNRVQSGGFGYLDAASLQGLGFLDEVRRRRRR